MPPPPPPPVPSRPVPTHPGPTFHVKFEQFTHPSIARLFSLMPTFPSLPSQLWATALSLLYPNHAPPEVRSVTIYFRPMGGVAHTNGKRLDDSHKEIHFSLDYLKGLDDEKFVAEVKGVLLHELVHCMQYSRGCSGGFIEGIADYIRLVGGHPCYNWRRSGGKDPLAGYSQTGYFLAWAESEYNGLVEHLNYSMKDKKWDDSIWESCCGKKLEELWKDYKKIYNLE